MLCQQGLQTTVAGMVEAQQSKFGAIRQQLGAAAQGSHSATAALQQQTLELQTQLNDATAATTRALDSTASVAWNGTQVNPLLWYGRECCQNAVLECKCHERTSSLDG